MPSSSLFVDEVLSMWPTYHEALLEDHAQMQPGFGGKPSVKNVQDPAPKGLDAMQQQASFQLALVIGLWSPIAPPTQRCQAGDAALWLRSYQDHP
jgi:hypothetical protein